MGISGPHTGTSGNAECGRRHNEKSGLCLYNYRLAALFNSWCLQKRD